jgi:GNAT superfamily N-acetyltransferase
VPDPHPYWAAAGAVLYRDPDGREVVLAPWVYGRDPDPTDGHGRPDEQAAAAETVGLEWYDGDRRALRPLFAEAEDSAEQLDSYLEDGRVLVARRGARIVGHLQLVPAGAGEVELKNMAVVAEERGTGIGRRLVETAISAVHGENISRMVVATAAADIGNLRFYQRCGFRMNRIERDAFTPGTGYPDPIVIDGIPLCDRVWLDQPLNPPTRP